MRTPLVWFRAMFPPRTDTPLRMSDLNEVRDHLADLTIRLQAFDQRLAQYSTTHFAPISPEATCDRPE